MFVKVLLPVAVILLAASQHAAQAVNDAPVEWKAYRVASLNVSAKFPKLPIRYGADDPCEQRRTESFSAFAEDVVYTMHVHRRERSNAAHCGSLRLPFGAKVLEKRRDQLVAQGAIRTVDAAGNEVWTAAKKSFERTKIIDDLKNGRWIELVITARGEVDGSAFFESFIGGKDLQGIDIGEGSESTLGDRAIVDEADPSVSIKPDDPERTPLFIVAKVRAKYTEAARRAGVRGSVTLRVTFLANGGIGAVSVINGLEHGLTEQAVEAARKMVFLPEKYRGKPRATSRPVSFTFNIY